MHVTKIIYYFIILLLYLALNTSQSINQLFLLFSKFQELIINTDTVIQESKQYNKNTIPKNVLSMFR